MRRTLITASAILIGGCSSGLTDIERYALARQTFNATAESILNAEASGLIDLDAAERQRALELVESADALLDAWAAALADDRRFDGIGDAITVVRELIRFKLEQEAER